MSDRKKLVIAVVVLVVAGGLLGWQLVVKGGSSRPGPVGGDVEQPEDGSSRPGGGIRMPGDG